MYAGGDFNLSVDAVMEYLLLEKPRLARNVNGDVSLDALLAGENLAVAGLEFDITFSTRADSSADGVEYDARLTGCIEYSGPGMYGYSPALGPESNGEMLHAKPQFCRTLVSAKTNTNQPTRAHQTSHRLKKNKYLMLRTEFSLFYDALSNVHAAFCFQLCVCVSIYPSIAPKKQFQIPVQNTFRFRMVYAIIAKIKNCLIFFLKFGAGK